jgi:5-formyltetrahydrofolate cyclo-ligase
MTSDRSDARLDREAVAAAIRRRMRAIAQPDPRFGLDLSRFIPGFGGSAAAARRLAAEPDYRDARLVLAMPDAALDPLRRRLLAGGRDIVVPSFGLERGFLLIEAASVPADQEGFASWLDGLDRFGHPVSLADLQWRGRFDLVATGAPAVAINGLRFGPGARQLDIAWGILAEADLMPPAVPVVAIVHDAQVVWDPMPAAPTEVLVDAIVTPTRLIRVAPSVRPARLDRSLVDPAVADTPPLRELAGRTS